MWKSATILSLWSQKGICEGKIGEYGRGESYYRDELIKSEKGKTEIQKEIICIF